MPIVDSELKGKVIDIPPIHLDEHVAEPIGHITLDLTNIKVSGITLQSIPFTVTPPSTMLVGLQG